MDVGLSVSQGVANGSSPFIPASTNVIGAIMARERGPVGVAIKTTSLQEDRAAFGGVVSTQYGALLSRNLFKNSTTFGVEMHIVRAVGTGSANAEVELQESSTTVVTVKSGYKGYESPGEWGNSVSVILKAKGEINFTFEVYESQVLKETWLAPTLEEMISLVNEQSEFVFLEADTLTAMSTNDLSGTLSGGVSSDPVEADAVSQFSALDGIEINLLVSSEFHTATHAVALKTHAATIEAMAVCNLAENSGLTEAQSYGALVNENGPNFTASYLSWVKTTDESGGYRWVPSHFSMIGAGFIRKPGLQGDNVAVPTGGVEANLIDIIDIKPRTISQVNINTYVQEYLVNPLVARDGYGFFSPSSRTGSSNPLYHSIHVLRQTLYYIQTLKDNNLILTQQRNTPELQRQAYVSAFTFFKGEYDAGNLERSVPFDVACEIITDKTVNPVSQDRKIFNMVINWIPTEQTESVGIRLQRNDGRLLVEAI